MIPGGKWMPLRKRTVRDDSGAWSLLKNAAVLASATANSLASTTALKFATAVAGAPVFRNTPSTRPARSETAMTKGSDAEAAAALITLCTSA